jgi:hypothetical protein
MISRRGETAGRSRTDVGNARRGTEPNKRGARIRASYYYRMLEEESPRAERVRTAEVIAALSQATDLSIGVPLEHGLRSTLFAMRLGERLGVDSETASQTYYACLLFYIGCTAGAELAAELFGDDDALTTYATPGRFGSRLEIR